MSTTAVRSLMEPQEVAALLRVSPGTLRTWHSKGLGPPAIKVGKFLRYRPEDVETWLDEQKTAS